jgi:hypothetical protein
VRFKRYNNREGMDVITTKMLPGMTDDRIKTLLYTPVTARPHGSRRSGQISGQGRQFTTRDVHRKLFDPENIGISSTLVVLTTMDGP